MKTTTRYAARLLTLSMALSAIAGAAHAQVIKEEHLLGVSTGRASTLTILEGVDDKGICPGARVALNSPNGDTPSMMGCWLVPDGEHLAIYWVKEEDRAKWPGLFTLDEFEWEPGRRPR